MSLWEWSLKRFSAQVPWEDLHTSSSPCDDEALNSSEYKSFKRNYTELPCPCANTVECRLLLCNVRRMWPYEILPTPGATCNIQILVGMWPHMVLHTGASREFTYKLVLVNMRICTKHFSSWENLYTTLQSLWGWGLSVSAHQTLKRMCTLHTFLLHVWGLMHWSVLDIRAHKGLARFCTQQELHTTFRSLRECCLIRSYTQVP